MKWAESLSAVTAAATAAATMALPVLALPFLQTRAPVQSGMLLLIVLGTAITVQALAVALGRRIPRAHAAYFAGVPLAIAAAVSIAGGTLSNTTLWGDALAADTLGAALIASLLCGVALFGSVRAVRIASAVFVGAALLASILGIARPELVAAGDWRQVALVVDGVLVLAAGAAASASGRVRIAYASAALLAAIMTAWYMSAAAYVAFFILAVSAALALRHGARSDAFRFLGFGCALAAIAIVCGIMMAPTHTSTEATPSLKISAIIAGQSYSESVQQALVGTGKRFTDTWTRYEPLAVNSTPLWNAPPAYANSTAVTIAITWGIFGLLALLFYPVAAFFALRAAARREADMPALFALSAYWFIMLFFSPGVIALLLLAATTGLCVRLALPSMQYKPGRTAPYAAAAALAIVGLFIASAGTRQLISSELRAHALDEAPASALDTLERAAAMWPSASNFRAASRAAYQVARDSSSEMSPDEVRRTAALLKAREYALAQEDSSVETLLYKASLFTDMYAGGYASVKEDARQALDSVSPLAPYRPEVPYLRARIALTEGDRASALRFALQALQLKPDLDYAIRLAVSIGS